ncbi:MAG: hypothetical protein E6K49_05050 [Gammaproteobacteria bacterium]|nr:MAG: hypothetical protein E6K52_01260 [Gammaproteobacteria bacterium]TLY78772.1 MAG: hypothetical protein E6K49_05050 [Gammaproteobacteria bacterium]
MQIHTSAVFIAALIVGLAACGKPAEEAPAAAQTAQTTASGTETTASGTTTNFEAQRTTTTAPPTK